MKKLKYLVLLFAVFLILPFAVYAEDEYTEIRAEENVGNDITFDKIKDINAVAGEESYKRPVIQVKELTLGLRKIKNPYVAIVKSREKKTTNILLNRDALAKLGYVIHPNNSHMLTDEMQKVKII